jgi:hypothetical protein
MPSIGTVALQIAVEKLVPFLDDYSPSRTIPQLPRKLAISAPVDDQEATILHAAPFPGALQLAGIEGPVAAPSDNDDVPEGDTR